MSAPDDLPPDWRDLDGIRSYEAAIAELRRRHLAGEPVHELPMFQPRKPSSPLAQRPAGGDMPAQKEAAE